MRGREGKIEREKERGAGVLGVGGLVWCVHCPHHIGGSASAAAKSAETSKL